MRKDEIRLQQKKMSLQHQMMKMIMMNMILFDETKKNNNNEGDVKKHNNSEDELRDQVMLNITIPLMILLRPKYNTKKIKFSNTILF